MYLFHNIFKNLMRYLIISWCIYLFQEVFNDLMVRVPGVAKMKITETVNLTHQSRSVGGANAALVQPTALGWSWFFGNMASPISENLNEIFGELVNMLWNK